MKLLDEILSLIYPPRCAACDRLIENEGFCDNCLSNLQPILKKRCFRCGLPKKECDCKNFVYHFDGITSPYLNDGTAQQAIYNFKFRKNFGCIKLFSANMAEYVKNAFEVESIDLVCCVPSTKISINKRGFNQSEVLARQVAKELDKPFECNLIVKKIGAITQHHLNLTQRFSNVRNSFCVKSRLNGKTILLVDDIKTTGASLDECARQLKFAGASKVYCVTALISKGKHNT